MIRTITGIPGGGGGAAVTIGTTTITNGTTTRILFNNAGVAGEYAISGTGSVAMTTSPAFTTPSLGAATATSVNGLNVTLGGGAVATNVAIGAGALYSNITGHHNTAVGFPTLTNNQSGEYNTAVGADSLELNVNGSYNTAVGYASLFVTTGNNNAALGSRSLLLLTSGSNNVAVGFESGHYWTGSDAFFVNNQDRGNSSGDQTKSIIYGTFAAAAADQQLTFNVGTLNVQNASGSGTVTLATTNTTLNLFNTGATTVNFAGAATAVSAGAATGTFTVNNATLSAKAITATGTVTGGTTTGSPVFNFSGDTTTGFGRAVSSNLSAYAAGTEYFRCGITGGVATLQIFRAVTISQPLSVTGITTLANTTATPAGGSTAARTLMGTTAGFGIYYGSGAPTVSAAKGSLYLRSDGSATNDRMYVNTDGSVNWTPVTTAA